ncbi:hypothetical protein AAVH_08118 [Aphelenchoides avenae]|nr:hypothetical protein AAVH_08118 [Aphelenchus avenae]
MAAWVSLGVGFSLFWRCSASSLSPWQAGAVRPEPSKADEAKAQAVSAVAEPKADVVEDKVEALLEVVAAEAVEDEVAPVEDVMVGRMEKAGAETAVVLEADEAAMVVADRAVTEALAVRMEKNKVAQCTIN